MQQFAILSPGVFLCLTLLMKEPDRFQHCLPPDIKVADVASAQFVRSTKSVKKITVGQKLAELKARCRRGKLVDASGKEIRFFKLIGCWGNPPADYQEILQKQSDELEKLRKRYTVIEMTCNPEGVHLH